MDNKTLDANFSCECMWCHKKLSSFRWRIRHEGRCKARTKAEDPKSILRDCAHMLRELQTTMHVIEHAEMDEEFRREMMNEVVKGFIKLSTTEACSWFTKMAGLKDIHTLLAEASEASGSDSDQTQNSN